VSWSPKTALNEARARLYSVRAGYGSAASRVVDIFELLAAIADGLALRDLSGQLTNPERTLR